MPPSDNSKTTASRLSGFTLAETLEKNLQPVPVVIEGLLHNGHATLSGPPKEGKSYVALELACAVAEGRDAFGCQPVKRKGKVLYLCLEDGERRVRQRLDRLLEGKRPAWLSDIKFVYELPESLDYARRAGRTEGRVDRREVRAGDHRHLHRRLS
jgi:RecA-family ATPase